MGPARVKCYGLFWITRRTYLVFQFIGLLICIALIAIGLSVMLRTRVIFPHVPAMNVQDDIIYQTLLSFFWIGVLFLVAGSIETIVMLRKFTRAAAEQKARLANVETVEPVPAPPSSTAVQPPPGERPNTNIQP
jgi:TRAP-type C4-dicarboxylate transport system permease small subunit